MKITQIRNATLRVEYGGKIFIIDPWLAGKGECGTFGDLPREMGIEPTRPEMADIPYPLCDLPRAASEVIAGADAYLLTHLHPDHFDVDLASGTGGAKLDKKTLIVVQNAEESEFMARSGFEKIEILESELRIGGVKITRAPSRHGTQEPCGPTMGLVLEAEGEKTLYIAGDTVWFEGVADTLAQRKPGVVLLNACAAELKGFGRLIMDDADVAKVYEAAPNAVIIASHLDVVPHATITRESMRERLAKRGILDKILIPNDGETLEF